MFAYKLINRILLGIGFFALLLAAWLAAVNTPSLSRKQSDLIARADAYTAEGIYVLAAPLLEEAAGYAGDNTLEAESRLKNVYLELIGQRGVRNKYTALLNKQMNRPDATPEVFMEAARFYIDTNKLSEALKVLKNGVAKLNAQNLIDLYEAERYVFELSRIVYADATVFVNGKIQVCEDGLWGLANADGSLAIACKYDKISNYSNARSIVVSGDEIYAVDINDNRMAVLRESASDIGNYGNDRVGILTADGWKRSTGDFTVGSLAFEQIGMYSGGYAAAKTGGKWGVVDTGSEWLLPAEYDEIISDEIGRVYAQEAVFARKDDGVLLFTNGINTGNIYDDARPFNENGWAAVKQNGKWGFIDTAGAFKIAPQFDDALSFGGHLAAVKQGEAWGYVAATGKIAIEPQFLAARSFQNGNAPVQTERGWQIISLLEYKQNASF